MSLVVSALTLFGCGQQERPPEPRSSSEEPARIAEAHEALVAPVCITIQRTGAAAGVVADTQLASDPTKATKNYGTNVTFIAGQVGAGQRQALLRFDLSAVPQGATVNSAVVNLYGTYAFNGQVRAHRITAPWNEESVTWNSFNGAFAPAVEASFFGDLGPLSFSLQPLVQAWVNGTTPNDGILFEESAPASNNFASSEATPASQRPAMTVCYTPRDLCPGVVCAAPDACHVAGTCDPSTGQCSSPPAPNGTACSDGNACTQADSCQAGACVGASPVVCAAASACHVAATCDPATGQCASPPVPDGTACRDGNACTQADTCQAGACVGASPVVCAAPDGCHAAGSCDPATGQCSNPPVADGTACSDGNAATEYDTCQAGTCTGHDSVVITITSPHAGAIVSANTAQVTGTLSESATVTIGAVQATVNGLSFSATVPLHEGNNILAVAAKGASGNPGSASVVVIHDATPPRVAITAPSDKAVLAGNTTTVTGTVQDLLIGTVNPGDCSVTVNGIPALVENRGFRAEGVPIAEGAGTITVVAKDVAGNMAAAVVSVTGDMTSNAMIFASGGDGQGAVVGTTLAQPFTAFVANNAGIGQPNIPITFKVSRGNGVLTGGARTQTVLSDAQGFASTTLKVGSTAGAASDQVVATSPAFLGAATFAANATPDPAGARVLAVASGGNQRGAVNKLAAQPLGVLLADDKGNPITGQTVTFTVRTGGGRVDGASSVTRTTDTDGRAYVLFTLGPALGEGAQFVDAAAPGANAVQFLASAVDEGPPASTQVSGVVLTNENNPIINVHVSIKGTTLTTLTDAEGRFSLPGAPVGPIHLEIDGTTGGPFPTLSFDLDLISGVDNTMDRPIYLPAVDTDGMGTANPTTDVVLRRADTPGLELTIPAGSATFVDPSGNTSKVGTVQVLRVHRDKMPMLPSDGALPTLVFAIMPHAAHFDPPAPIRFPNVDGRAPGEIVQIYSYDHDLGAFVVVGTATVSEDGQEVRSEWGQGIRKGGWHYTPPAPVPTDCFGTTKCTILKCDGGIPGSPLSCAWVKQIDIGSSSLPTVTSSASLSDDDLAIIAASGTNPWSPDSDCYTLKTNTTNTPGVCVVGQYTCDLLIERTPTPAGADIACKRRYNGVANDPLMLAGANATNFKSPDGKCIKPTDGPNAGNIMCCPPSFTCPVCNKPSSMVCCDQACTNNAGCCP